MPGLLFALLNSSILWETHKVFQELKMELHHIGIIMCARLRLHGNIGCPYSKYGANVSLFNNGEKLKPSGF